MPASRSRLLALVVLVLSALAVAPGIAHARTGACVAGDAGGPRCTVWTGKVTFVADGDTVDIDVAGDGTGTPVRVRVTGIQAMEQSVYSRYAGRRRGECHALAATRRLEGLVRRARGRVRLAAQRPTSQTGARRRARRSLALRVGGRWRDPARVLVAEGLALWLPNPVEYAWNADYGRLTEQAAHAGRGLFTADACGAGPAARVPLRLDVTWDADGNDGENLNGEWIRIANDGAVPVRLAGWWVRDSHLRRFRFPSWAEVPAGAAVRVRVGAGRSSATDFHWGLGAPAFENVDPARGMGDGAYLFDPQGDLRAWDIYR